MRIFGFLGMLSLGGGAGVPLTQYGLSPKKFFFLKWAENDFGKISSTANVSMDHTLFRRSLLVLEVHAKTVIFIRILFRSAHIVQLHIAHPSCHVNRPKLHEQSTKTKTWDTSEGISPQPV